ncbi:MAG: glycine dehydrogenase (aminomethyl-transferring) [Legionella sp.]|nr:MAG: glycine dehydrogenase (aminomethyl-transferring) [Legionella sp.]
MLIFEQSQPFRQARAQGPGLIKSPYTIPSSLQRTTPPKLPACSELQVVRHYTQLSQKNFSIDTQFYPLGSCTMKYNPRGVHKAASLAGFLQRHPLTPWHYSQGTLQALFDLQEYLKDITGMTGVSLTPMAGSQGEFAGVAMIKAYHQSRGDTQRDEILIPDAAHGTNPASAIICGYKVVELTSNAEGDIDLDELRKKTGPKTAGIMLTNPSTLGLFMRQIKEIAAIIHTAGGLLYYDGANLNAIIGKVRPGDMGFDVMHLNLHKTFATPHGGGGPGAGPVAVGPRLEPFLPMPIVVSTPKGYQFATKEAYPNTIGRLSCFMGNVGILLRAYFYIRLLGQSGLERIADYATLNANYLLAQLNAVGFHSAYPNRRASHEFLLTLKQEKKNYGISAMDLAKRLLDFGVHAPTTYFPIMVPECLLIEPTETECKETLDQFIIIMQTVLEEAQNDPQKLKNAPHTLPVKRLDDVRAARELRLNYYQVQQETEQ